MSFWLCLLLLRPSWRPQRDARSTEKERNKKKNKGKKSGLTTPSGSGGGTLVGRNSGLRLESEKARENKASIGEASSTVEGGRSEIVPCAVSEGGAESDDAVGVGFREAVEGENFGWLKENCGELEGIVEIYLTM